MGRRHALSARRIPQEGPRETPGRSSRRTISPRKKERSVADRIVKSVVLHAPPHSVWPALTDAKAFGTWFGAEFDGSFTPGAHLTGRTSTCAPPPAWTPTAGRISAT